ncbi:MAG: hypothetical protein JEY79_04135 [Pseudodesulfovibrio sp.]|nr:hypothetical protein [Pseudodesulfovibrio sp.]
MQAIFNAISRFISKPTDGKDDSSERFLARCDNFRLLLAANNKALEIMAEMTEESQSGSLFGMSHVRGQSLKVAAGVRQMIERLCRMNPGKYDALKDTFNRIVLEMETAVVDHADRQQGPLVLALDEINAESISEAGSKMALLGEVCGELGVRVPLGFSITASAFRLFMDSTGLDDEINRLIQITDSIELDELYALEASIHHAIDLAAMPQELKEAIETGCNAFSADKDTVRLAIRSSALGEDSSEASFAGQFLSVLGVRPDNVLESYRSVVASMYSATAMTYRLSRGLREDGVIMCVGCMEMIDATAGGVIYTRDPVGKHEDALIVSAVPGLPCAIVDGTENADTWVLDRESLFIRKAVIVDKKWRHVVSATGGTNKERLLGNECSAPSISNDVVAWIAGIALRIEAHFDCPQDIEWAQDHDGRIFILQCRPLAVCEVQGEPESLPEIDKNAPFAILTDCIPSSPGIASGHVFMVETDEDMLRFPEGAILLVRTAKPRLSALLPKAAALIAEFGNATGHLANIAREFGIPALVGAPGAVDRLSRVGVVTVNAKTGTVYLGRRDDQMPGSNRIQVAPRNNEVVTALCRTLQFITPLTLTNPDSPEFAPENCVSLHDITRFCHEKAVAEMFRDGDRPGAKARRLVDKGPLQYWLVDLGGGTSVSNEDEYVDLRCVTSNAMRALWVGMTTIPWEGPPPVDPGGFMSIISEAAQNPSLAPGMANEMAERNYFIVSRNYCNLQSRFGFHFCTVEGFAGDEPDRNYAFFQFKGGAADKSRRMIRARLIADVLERQGFIAEVRDDALFARIEGVSKEAVERALAVTGYLLVHTRQIDMVMFDNKACQKYRDKFDTDIMVILNLMQNDNECSSNWRRES